MPKYTENHQAIKDAYTAFETLTKNTLLGQELAGDPSLREAMEYAIYSGSFMNHVKEEDGSLKMEIDGIDLSENPGMAKDLLIKKELEAAGTTPQAVMALAQEAHVSFDEYVTGLRRQAITSGSDPETARKIAEHNGIYKALTDSSLSNNAVEASLYQGWLDEHNMTAKQLHDTWPKSHKYSVGRTAAESLIVGLLVAGGMSIEDALDPAKGTKEKAAVSREVVSKLYARNKDGEWIEDYAWFAEKSQTAARAMNSAFNKRFKTLDVSGLAQACAPENGAFLEFTNAMGDLMQEMAKKVEKGGPYLLDGHIDSDFDKVLDDLRDRSLLGQSAIHAFSSLDPADTPDEFAIKLTGYACEEIRFREMDRAIKNGEAADPVEILNQKSIESIQLYSLIINKFRDTAIGRDPRVAKVFTKALVSGQFAKYLSIDKNPLNAAAAGKNPMHVTLQGVDVLAHPEQAEELFYLDELGLTYQDAERIRKNLGVDVLKEPWKASEATFLDRCGFTSKRLETMAARENMTVRDYISEIARNPELAQLRASLTRQADMAVNTPHPGMEAQTNRRMLHLFGPEFQYDPDLKLTYTLNPDQTEQQIRDGFTQKDYSLPAGSRFTAEDAAFIGFASLSLSRIGGQRIVNAQGAVVQDVFYNDELRAYNSYTLLLENTMSGKLRKGVAFNHKKIIADARANVPVVLSAYEKGNKTPLAEVLTGALVNSENHFRIAPNLSYNVIEHAKLAARSLDMLRSDPDMLRYAEEKGVLTQGLLDMVEAGRAIAGVYDRMETLGRDYVKKIAVGELPSEAEKKEFLTAYNTCLYVEKEIMRSGSEYSNSAGSELRLNRIMQAQSKISAAVSAEPDPARKQEIQLAESRRSSLLHADLNNRRPLSDILRDLGKPGAMEDLQRMIGGTDSVVNASTATVIDILNSRSFGEDLSNFNESFAEGEADPIGDTIKQNYGVSSRYTEGAFIRGNVAVLENCAFILENSGPDLNASLDFIDPDADVPGQAEFVQITEAVQNLLAMEQAIMPQEAGTPNRITEQNAKEQQRAYEAAAKLCEDYMKIRRENPLPSADQEEPIFEPDAGYNAAEHVLQVCREAAADRKDAAAFLASRRKVRAAAVSGDINTFRAFTPESVGAYLKDKNARFAKTQDGATLQRLGEQLTVALKYVADKELTPEQCGFTKPDLDTAMDNVRSIDLNADRNLSATGRIVDRINAVRQAIGKPAITDGEYLALCKADPEYQANKAAGDLFRRKEALLGRYPLSDRNAFARVARFYLDPDDTPEAKEFNDNFIQSISTPEGQIRLFTETLQKAAELGPDALYPESLQAHRERFVQDMGFYKSLFTIKSIYETLRQNGVRLAPEVEKFYNTMQQSWEWQDTVSSEIIMKSSPYYPALHEVTDPDVSIAVSALTAASTEATSTRNPGKEYAELGMFSSMGFGVMNAAGSKANETARAMLQDGTLPNDTYHYIGRSESKTDISVDAVILAAAGKKPRTGFMKKSDREIQMIDAQLRKPLVTQKEYEHLAFLATVVPEPAVTNPNLTREAMQARIDKTFGPDFVYDDLLLSTETYSEKNFRQENYRLPDNCPFSEHQAALIGVALFSTDEIAGQERIDTYDSVDLRVGANYGFVIENMMSGAPRAGLGDVLTNGFVKARSKTPEVIRQYTEGNKRELALALASAVRNSAQTISTSVSVSGTLTANAAIAGECLELLSNDPEMMAIAKADGGLNDEVTATVRSGSAISDLHTEFMTKGKAYMDKLLAGEVPSREETLEIVTLDYTAHYIADHFSTMSDAQNNSEVNKYLRNRAEDDVQQKSKAHAKLSQTLSKAEKAAAAEADPQAKAEKLQQVEALREQVRMAKEASDEAFRNFNELSAGQATHQEFDDFCLDLGKPGAIADLKEYFRSDKEITELAKKDPKELINELHLNTPTAGFKRGLGKEKLPGNPEDAANRILAKYGMRPQTIVTRETVSENALRLKTFTNSLHEAQRDVHFGSSAYDTAERMACNLCEAETKLGTMQKLSKSNLTALSYSRQQTIEACDAYLTRKKNQGKLDAGLNTKDGKRIAVIRELRAYCVETKCYYDDAVKQLTLAEKVRGLKPEHQAFLEQLESMEPEQLGTTMKSLIDMASHTEDPRQYKKIGQQLRTIGEHIMEHNLDVAACGLDAKDFTAASRISFNAMRQNEPQVKAGEKSKNDEKVKGDEGPALK